MYFFYCFSNFTNFYILFFILFVTTTGLFALFILIFFSWTFSEFFTIFDREAVFVRALVSTVAISSVASGLKFVKYYFKGEKKDISLKEGKLEAELQLLKAQFNPHFLFNAINNIYFLIHKDQAQASQTLIHFSDMLRYQLYECNTDKIPIEKEIVYLQNYLAIAKLRKGDNVRVDFKAPERNNGFAIAPFVLLPFIENAFKYVSSFANKLNFITIEISYFKGLFRLNVTNSIEKKAFPGLEVLKEETRLRNVMERLVLVYPSTHTLDLNAEEEYFEVTLTIKINED